MIQNVEEEHRLLTEKVAGFMKDMGDSIGKSKQQQVDKIKEQLDKQNKEQAKFEADKINELEELVKSIEVKN